MKKMAKSATPQQEKLLSLICNEQEDVRLQGREFFEALGLDRLKDAKELFDVGMISANDFENIKAQCLSEMGISVPAASQSSEGNPLGGSQGTQIATSSMLFSLII